MTTEVGLYILFSSTCHNWQTFQCGAFITSDVFKIVAINKTVMFFAPSDKITSCYYSCNIAAGAVNQTFFKHSFCFITSDIHFVTQAVHDLPEVF